MHPGQFETLSRLTVVSRTTGGSNEMANSIKQACTTLLKSFWSAQKTLEKLGWSFLARVFYRQAFEKWIPYLIAFFSPFAKIFGKQVLRCDFARQYIGARDVTRGARGRWKVPTMSQVLSSIHYICFRKTSASNMGQQTCFLPQVPFNLVTPLTGGALNANGNTLTRTFWAHYFSLSLN